MSDQEVISEAVPIDGATFVAHIDWEGVSLKIPKELDDLDPDSIEAFENGKAITAVRSIFGSGEYDRARDEFAKLHGRRPTMRDIGKLSDAIAAHFGFENAGN